MRTLIRITISLAVLAAVLHLAGCGSDPAPETGAEKATKLLTAATWNTQSVTVGGASSTIYNNLKVTFTATGFTATHGGSVWPASGTWKFTDDTGETMVRGDGLSISVTELTSTKVVMRLAWNKTTLGGGRSESLSGQHVFTFGK